MTKYEKKHPDTLLNIFKPSLDYLIDKVTKPESKSN